MNASCIHCNQPVREGARFCKHCGASQDTETATSHENVLLHCSCGNQILPNQKFCTGCGLALQGNARPTGAGTERNISPNPRQDRLPKDNKYSRPERAKVFPLRKPVKYAILISGAVLILAMAVIVMLRLPGLPKGELLFSQELLPSDSDQVVSAGKGLEIVMPLGEIDKPRLLEVRTAPGLPAPGNNGQLISAYDIKLDGKTEFDGYLDIRMALPEGRFSDFVCLYYNTSNKEWEGVPYEINTRNRDAIISTRHLSIFSLVKQDSGLVPGPMMKLGHTRFPSGRMMNHDNMLRILRSYSTNSQLDEKEAYVEGWSVFTEWFGLSGAGLDFVEGAGHIDDLSEINGVLDNLGVGFAMAQAAVSLSEGDTASAVFIAMKDMANYSIKNLIFDTRPMNIAMVGVFAFDYSLNKFAEKAISGRFEIYNKAYRLYYKEKESREGINSVWWYKNLKNAARKANNIQEAKKAVDDLFLGYFQEFWKNDEVVALYQDKVSGQGFSGGGGLSEDVKKNISQAYMSEIRNSIDWVFQRIIRETRIDFLEKLHKQLENLRKSMNREYFIDVKVKVESASADQFPNLNFEGMRVSFEVRNPAHKGKWDVRLNRKGEAVMQCTLLGYLHSGAPKMVSIRIPDPDRPGDSLTFSGELKFSVTKHNQAEILIGIPDKDAIKGTWEVEGVLEDIEVVEVYQKLLCPKPSQAQVDAALNSYRQLAGSKPVKLDNLEIQGLLMNHDIQADGNTFVVTYNSIGGSIGGSTQYRVQLKGKGQFEGSCSIPVYLNDYCGIWCKARYTIKGKKVKNYQL